jgi:DNA-directed RNA polymerase specialized sigma24 family protein
MGEVEIEVDERYYDLLKEMDRAVYNSDRKYLRRQAMSIDEANSLGLGTVYGDDPLNVLIQKETIERLYMALDELTPNQQSLAYLIYFKKEKIADLAFRIGVSPVAIKNRLCKIHARLEKNLQKGG